MDAKTRVPARFTIMVLAASASLFWVVGCALDKNGVQPGKTYARIGGHSGQLLEPKRVLLKVAIISRPFGDPAINEIVWKAADEQIIPPKDRHAWEVNGLRVGRIIGELPMELEAIMNDTKSSHKVTPTTFFIESGEPTLIKVSDPVERRQPALEPRQPRLRQRLRRCQRLFSRDRPARRCQQRLAAAGSRVPPWADQAHVPGGSHRGSHRRSGIPDQQRPGRRDDPRAGDRPGAAARPDRRAGLPARTEARVGDVLLHPDVAHSEQRLEKLILIWASRNMQGIGPDDRGPKTKDRPSLFKRLVGPPEAPQGPARPGPSIPASPGVEITPPDPRSARPDAGNHHNTAETRVAPAKYGRGIGEFGPITAGAISSEPGRVIYNAQAAG